MKIKSRGCTIYFKLKLPHCSQLLSNSTEANVIFILETTISKWEVFCKVTFQLFWSLLDRLNFFWLCTICNFVINECNPSFEVKGNEKNPFLQNTLFQKLPFLLRSFQSRSYRCLWAGYAKTLPAVLYLASWYKCEWVIEFLGAEPSKVFLFELEFFLFQNRKR